MLKLRAQSLQIKYIDSCTGGSAALTKFVPLCYLVYISVSGFLTASMMTLGTPGSLKHRVMYTNEARTKMPDDIIYIVTDSIRSVNPNSITAKLK